MNRMFFQQEAAPDHVPPRRTASRSEAKTLHGTHRGPATGAPWPWPGNFNMTKNTFFGGEISPYTTIYVTYIVDLGISLIMGYRMDISQMKYTKYKLHNVWDKGYALMYNRSLNLIPLQNDGDLIWRYNGISYEYHGACSQLRHVVTGFCVVGLVSSGRDKGTIPNHQKNCGFDTGVLPPNIRK